MFDTLGKWGDPPPSVKKLQKLPGGYKPIYIEEKHWITQSLATLGLQQCIVGMSAHIYERVTSLILYRASLLPYVIVPWNKL